MKCMLLIKGLTHSYDEVTQSNPICHEVCPGRIGLNGIELYLVRSQ